MAITLINGYQCSNCTDIDNAKKNIDPAHPQDGPYGINAPKDSGRDRSGDTANPPAGPTGNANRPAVIYGGSLAALNPAGQAGAASTQDLPLPPNVRQGAGAPGSGFSLTV